MIFTTLDSPEDAVRDKEIDDYSILVLRCFICGDWTDENDLSWCKTCQADICGQCDCGHDTSHRTR